MEIVELPEIERAAEPEDVVQPEAEVIVQPKPEPEVIVQPEPEPEVIVQPETVIVDEDEGEKTIREDPIRRWLIDEGEETIREPKLPPVMAVLLRPATAEGFVLSSAQNRLGRSAKKCEIHLAGNGSISNTHAQIIQNKGVYYLMDLGSSNGTFVEDVRLAEGEQVQLEEVSVFRLYDELFLFVSGARAQKIYRAGIACFLRSAATGNVQMLDTETTPLDRKHAWSDGTLNDRRISRNHAKIIWEDGKPMLMDVGSANGTYCNDQQLESMEPVELHNADKIHLGDTILEIGIVKL